VHSIAYNLEFSQAFIAELERYLLSDQVFWPLGGRASDGEGFPRGTLGQLLLSMDELSTLAEEMDPEQIAAYHKVEQSFEAVQEARPANLESKAWAEVGRRLTLWQATLRDMQEADLSTQSYRNDVRNRFFLTRLQSLLSAGGRLRKLRAQLTRLDGVLRARFITNDFIWHARMRHLYDAETYWFLYGRPVVR
jgi:hypothetical protein